jgi:D-alanyl-D-alanine carboxypeptidase/D-alanyl-D-alanine-endopeptidase (penicillin-binding protein 4)
MKSSQNQYAETLLRAIARSEPGAVATTEGGRDVVRRVLAGWGIPADSFVQADGSGLSRYNYVAAGTLANVLAHMYRDPRHRGPWIESLAVGGVDGTLDKRFKGTSAEGRVRAKTGSIANVRALSGYVPAANGEQLLFVIVLNNVTAPGPRLTAVSDGIVVRLTRFAR